MTAITTTGLKRLFVQARRRFDPENHVVAVFETADEMYVARLRCGCTYADDHEVKMRERVFCSRHPDFDDRTSANDALTNTKHHSGADD